MPNGDKRTAHSAEGSKLNQFLSEQQQHIDAGRRVFGETTGQNRAFGCEAAVLGLQAVSDKNLFHTCRHVDLPPSKFRCSMHIGSVPAQFCWSCIRGKLTSYIYPSWLHWAWFLHLHHNTVIFICQQQQPFRWHFPFLAKSKQQKQYLQSQLLLLRQNPCATVLLWEPGKALNTVTL